VDPDGWDRTGQGDGVDFYKTRISLDDFISRSIQSTTMGSRSEYTERLRLLRDIHKTQGDL
jgi:hypothetical protein